MKYLNKRLTAAQLPFRGPDILLQLASLVGEASLQRLDRTAQGPSAELCEQWHDDKPLLSEREPKWSNERLLEEINIYRAQIQARAVENNVWIVKSNVARGGSHGHSCIINPFGRIVSEAGFDEELLVSEMNISEATAAYATKSFLKDFQLSDWWRQGVEQFVKVHPPLPPPRK